jgi:hypothetical protein
MAMPSKLRAALSERSRPPQAFVKVDLEGIEDLVKELKSLASSVSSGQQQSSTDSERVMSAVLSSIDMVGNQLLQAIRDIPQVEIPEFPEFPAIEKPPEVDLSPVLDALDGISASLRRKPIKKKPRFEFTIERDEDGLIERVTAIGE